MNKPQAERYVAKWKSKIGLDGWSFYVKGRHPFDIDAEGCVDVTNERQSATIELSIPPRPGEDMEVTVLHELCHAYFPLEGLDSKSYAYVRAEQGVDALSNLMVQQDREIQSLRKKVKELESEGSRPPAKPDRGRKLPPEGHRNNP